MSEKINFSINNMNEIMAGNGDISDNHNNKVSGNDLSCSGKNVSLSENEIGELYGKIILNSSIMDTFKEEKDLGEIESPLQNMCKKYSSEIKR
jgi:hypothetical protein